MYLKSTNRVYARNYGVSVSVVYDDKKRKKKQNT